MAVSHFGCVVTNCMKIRLIHCILNGSSWKILPQNLWTRKNRLNFGSHLHRYMDPILKDSSTLRDISAFFHNWPVANMRENYNTSIHARPRPDSWLVCCPFRCHHEWRHEWQHGGLCPCRRSFGCVLLLDRIFRKQRTVRQYTTLIYLINLLGKLVLG